ncbi:sensor histidine kinase [Dyella terrae]|nr:histidine kinase [Dyella terrae]
MQALTRSQTPGMMPLWVPLAAGLPITLCMGVMALPELVHQYAGLFRVLYAVGYLFWIVPLSLLQRAMWRRNLRWRVTVPVLLIATYIPSVINNGIGQAAAVHWGLVKAYEFRRIFAGLDGCWLALIAFCAIHAMVLHYDALQQSRRREAESAALASEAQLRALQYQLHPHFLFNTLNSISALVADDRRHEATRMIARLGDLLRATLERSDSREVTLAEELSLTEHYLDVEKARLGSRLRMQTRVGPGVLHALVPPLLLQPLVENAIRHGIAMRPSGGALGLDIQAHDGMLAIELSNDGVASSANGAEAGGTSIGLANVRQRLQTLYGDAQDLSMRLAEDGACVVCIRLPLRLVALPEEVSA